MNQDELKRRKALTFEQAEGLEELPRQLDRDEMPQVLRARLLNVFTQDIDREKAKVTYSNSLPPKWSEIIERWLVRHVGETDPKKYLSHSAASGILKQCFEQSDALAVYGVTQSLVRHARLKPIAVEVAKVLEEEHAAYRLVDGDTLMPVGSPEEAQAIAGALSDTRLAGQAGANAHLKRATAHLSEGSYADSVRESIHAVESTVRTLTGKSKVSDAVDELAKTRHMHEAFRKAVLLLYGFGSDEPGVRHPLLDKGDAAVTESDAMVMLGICAALTSYFLRSFTGMT